MKYNNHKMEARCNTCKVATYGEAGRKLLIEKQYFWCVNCLFVYKVVRPFPAEYFQPELDVNYVLDKQKRMWECGKRDNYFKNR